MSATRTSVPRSYQFQLHRNANIVKSFYFIIQKEPGRVFDQVKWGRQSRDTVPVSGDKLLVSGAHHVSSKDDMLGFLIGVSDYFWNIVVGSH